MAFVAASHDSPSLEAVNARTNALQSEIWTDVSALVRAQPNPVTTSLMASLNDVFDMTTAERFAFDLPVQPQIFWLLIGLTMLGTATISYQMVLRGPDARFLSALLMLTWTIVIVDNLDLGAGRIGDIRTSVAAYEWTLQGFQAPGPAAATAR